MSIDDFEPDPWVDADYAYDLVRERRMQGHDRPMMDRDEVTLFLSVGTPAQLMPSESPVNGDLMARLQAEMLIPSKPEVHHGQV